jgi:hypothetical protein
MEFTYQDYHARCLKHGRAALSARHFERMRRSSWLLQQRLRRLETDAAKITRGKTGAALEKLCCEVLALIASVAFLLEDDLTVHPFELHKARKKALRVLRRWGPIMDQAGETNGFTTLFREIEARHRSAHRTWRKETVIEAQAEYDLWKAEQEVRAALCSGRLEPHSLYEADARTREAERGDLLAAQAASWRRVVATLSRDELRLLIRMAGKQRTP